MFADFGLGLGDVFDDPGADTVISVAFLQRAAAVGTAFQSMRFFSVNASGLFPLNSRMAGGASGFLLAPGGLRFLEGWNHARRRGRERRNGGGSDSPG